MTNELYILNTLIGIALSVPFLPLAACYGWKYSRIMAGRSTKFWCDEFEQGLNV